MGSTEFDSAKEAERFMDIPLPIVTPGFTLEVKNKWPADPWPKVGQMIPDPSWGPPQFFDVESGKRIEEPVRIDYDLMEVVPADHFEARVENGDRVYGASEVRQKLVDVIEKSKRELLRNWPNIQSALSPEEPVAVPVVVGGE